MEHALLLLSCMNNVRECRHRWKLSLTRPGLPCSLRLCTTHILVLTFVTFRLYVWVRWWTCSDLIAFWAVPLCWVFSTSVIQSQSFQSVQKIVALTNFTLNVRTSHVLAIPLQITILFFTTEVTLGILYCLSFRVWKVKHSRAKPSPISLTSPNILPRLKECGFLAMCSGLLFIRVISCRNRSSFLVLRLLPQMVSLLHLLSHRFSFYY